MELRNKFKQTEVGVIPKDWEVKNLGDIGEVKMCRRIFNHETNSNGEIPFYKIGTFGSEPDAYISRDLYKEYLKKFSFPRKGEILISAAGTIGRTIIYNGEEAYYQDSNIVWIDNNGVLVSNEFLFHVLQIAKYQTEGGTIQRLYNSILKETKFACPTLAEQTAIATALSDMDNLIAGLEQLIAKKKAIKQGAMQELLRPKEGWVVKKLGGLGEVFGGGTPSSFNPQFWNGNINWFTPTEIGSSKYLYESERKITKSGLENSSAKLLTKGTVLLTTRAAIGDVGILKNDAATNQGFQSMVINDKNDNEFVYYLLTTLKPELIRNASGSTFLEISPGKLKAVEICVPDKGEQRRISEILSDMDNEIKSLGEYLEKYKLLKQGMMHELLTGKTRLV